jgi:lipopolysaccharide export system protein LptA
MACKNCAAMPSTQRPLTLLPLLALLAVAPALAEKADHGKPMVFTSDKGGDTDGSTHAELIGNVVITQGSMLLQAERVNAKLTSDGYWQLFAVGPAGKQVNFRQARDVPGEFVEGFADQVDYDTKADVVRFSGHAVMRLMRGSLVASETTGAVVVYDNRTEQTSLEGGEAAAHPGGRTRIMIMPRDAGAAAPAAAASAVPLQPSTTLQVRKPS